MTTAAHDMLTPEGLAALDFFWLEEQWDGELRLGEFLANRASLLAAEVKVPRPGQLLRAVSVRRPYETSTSVILVEEPGVVVTPSGYEVPNPLAARRHSPQPGEPKASNQLAAHRLLVLVTRIAELALLLLLAALLLKAVPCFAETRPLPPPEALHKSIPLDNRGPGPESTGPIDLADKPGANGRGGGVELRAPIAPQRQAVTDPQAQQESDQGDPWVPQQFKQFLEHDHLLAYQLTKLALILFVGILVGGGGDLGVFAELYRTPRDWLRSAHHLAADIRDERRARKQRGAAIPYFTILAAAIMAFILGVFGPELDQALKDEIAPVQPGEAELVNAEARRICGESPTDNAGWLVDAHGAYVCTDKHGRRHRSQITTAIKVTR